MKSAIRAFAWTAVLVLLSCAALAQEGVWQSDYAKALEVSNTSGHALFAVFDRVSGQKSAHDVATALSQNGDFRSASRKFILVQVAGSSISQAKELEWYRQQAEPPAAAIVGFDGKPAKTYAEIPAADALAADMLQAFAYLAIDQADRLAASGDDRAAVAMYWDALTVKPPEAAGERARRALTEASRRGRVKIAEIEQMISDGKYLEAKKCLLKLADTYAGTDAARAATDRLSELTKDSSAAAEIARQEKEEAAAAILDRARKAAAADKPEEARQLYSQVVNDYAGTAAAKTAAEEAARLRKTSGAVATDEVAKAADEECRKWMSYADSFSQQDKQSEAIKYYKKVIEKYPKSTYAGIARQKLKALQ